jgi:fructose-1,6-bisphosphatase I
VITHPNVQVPPRGPIYSINEGNAVNWDEATKRYVEACKAGTYNQGKPYSLRYVGSMVADVHRTLLYGGIFMYPADKKSPKGKLRILYECFPMAMLVEQAGGKATTGTQRSLEMQPDSIHGRHEGCRRVGRGRAGSAGARQGRRVTRCCGQA